MSNPDSNPKYKLAVSRIKDILQLLSEQEKIDVKRLDIEWSVPTQTVLDDGHVLYGPRYILNIGSSETNYPED